MIKPGWLRSLSPRSRAFYKADQARDRGEPAAAASLYRKAIDRWGASFGMLVQLGNAQKDSGDYVGAERTYLEASAICPEDADLFLQRGHLMKLAGDLDRAADLYRQADLMDPLRGDAALELGRLYLPLTPQATAREYISYFGSLYTRPDLSAMTSQIYERILAQYRWRYE